MNESTLTLEAIAPGTCVVRNTAAHTGRAWALRPGRTASRHLHYGRVILGDARSASRRRDNLDFTLSPQDGDADDVRVPRQEQIYSSIAYR